MMTRDTVMILEDDEQRLESFQVALLSVNPTLKLLTWRDAPIMMGECREFLGATCLISLDHDLHTGGQISAAPGSGLDIAVFLAREQPVCPVLVHSTNYQKAELMCQVLRTRAWRVDRVIPSTEQWIWTMWLPRVQSLLSPVGLLTP